MNSVDVYMDGMACIHLAQPVETHGQAKKQYRATCNTKVDGLTLVERDVADLSLSCPSCQKQLDLFRESRRGV